MENNSIRDNLSKEDIVSDIRLCIGEDIHRRNVYLVVEGEDDINFLRANLADNVYLYESYDGKAGVEAIVDTYFPSNINVIGIRDKDYQILPISNKIFYYDCGCMEMMLIKNNQVFDNLCYEYYKGELSNLDLRSKVLRELKYLSIIRMHNERQQWGKTLRGISLSNAWDSEAKKIKNNVILNKLNSMNDNFFTSNIIEVLDAEYQQEWEENEYFEYTQGHDFSMLYATICNQYRRRGVKNTEIEACIRCIYRWDDFINTDLYTKITEYERLHQLSVWIPVA